MQALPEESRNQQSSSSLNRSGRRLCRDAGSSAHGGARVRKPAACRNPARRECRRRTLSSFRPPHPPGCFPVGETEGSGITCTLLPLTPASCSYKEWSGRTVVRLSRREAGGEGVGVSSLIRVRRWRHHAFPGATGEADGRSSPSHSVPFILRNDGPSAAGAVLLTCPPSGGASPGKV